MHINIKVIWYCEVGELVCLLSNHSFQYNSCSFKSCENSFVSKEKACSKFSTAVLSLTFFWELWRRILTA